MNPADSPTGGNPDTHYWRLHHGETRPKYAVFKWEDLNPSMEGGDTPGLTLINVLDVGILEDAVVIRRQDVFAAPAFAEYAGQINTFLDAMNTMVEMGAISALDERFSTMMAELEEKAEYFMAQSVLAYETESKIPD
jgi:hypothetical protein